jgi:predicted nucleic acid-binding protein
MNGNRYVLDTCAGIFLLNNDDSLSLQNDLEEAEKYVSVINRMELFAKPNITPKEEAEINEFLADTTVIPLDPIVEQEAINMRRATKVKLPDCIVAATAIVLGATLITGDDSLLKLKWAGYTVRPIQPEET